jgi:hypothetical protein
MEVKVLLLNVVNMLQVMEREKARSELLNVKMG